MQSRCKKLSLYGSVVFTSGAAALFISKNKIANCEKISNVTIEKSRFISFDLAQKISLNFETPVYVYDEKTLVQQASKTLQFPNINGLTVRFAMKSCPNAAILQLFHNLDISFDASSGYEVERAIMAGIPPSKISLSSQELPKNLKELILKGIEFNACSLHQLEEFGRQCPGSQCGVRFNPGRGSGGTGKTNVGGSTASFGIWHEYQEQVKEIAKRHGVTIKRIHTHIGSGSDPAVWQSVSIMSLELVRNFPEVTTLNLGGGFKVGRMGGEQSTDLQEVGRPVKEALSAFARETGRSLRLEIEPGTFLVANAGALLTRVQDVVDTGVDGHTFLKLDSGMTEVLRPSLYGAQHPIVVHSAHDRTAARTADYVVVGHCCESGDLFSCAPGDPEVLAERRLAVARVGDLVTVEGAGAYCSSMSTKNYNSFPEAPEVMVASDGRLHLIRGRQSLKQIVSNEVPYKR